MFGLFQLFGRSRELKALDHALRDAGVHPGTVPEAVKIAALRLLKQDSSAGAGLSEADYNDAAQLLGYCMLGHDQFIASNGRPGHYLYHPVLRCAGYPAVTAPPALFEVTDDEARWGGSEGSG